MDRETYWAAVHGVAKSQTQLSVLNIYASNTGASKYIKQILTDIKGGIDSNMIIAGDFNSPLKLMDESPGRNINNERLVLSDTLDQLDLTDIYRTFRPQTAQYTFFFNIHAIFSRADHILGKKNVSTNLRQ